MKRSLLIWMIFIAGVLLAWEAVLRTGIVSPAALAWPREVASAVPKVFYPSENLPDLLSTMWWSFVAFSVSVPLGIGLGIGVFFAGPGRQPAQFLLDFLRSVPATALVPFFLILYGTGDSTKVAVGIFSSSLVICLATIAGLSGRNATRLGIARILGITGLRRLVLFDIPEAASQLFLGLRTGISLALILVVVAEMLIGSSRGLGKVIYDMRYTDDKGRMYAALLAVGVVGYLYNLALSFLECRVIHWRGIE